MNPPTDFATQDGTPPQLARPVDGDDPRVGFARVTRESAIYALGSIAGKAVGLAMLPILTRLLVPSEYGQLDLLSTVGSALISALLLGLDVAAVRLASDREADATERAHIFGSWVAMSTILAGVASVALFVGADAISELLLQSDDGARAVRALSGVVLFGTYYVIGLGLLRVQRRPVAYAAVSAVTLFANAAAAIALVRLIEPSSAVILQALAASWALGSVLTFALAGRRSIKRPRLGDTRRLWVLALPLAPAVVTVWFAEVATRSIVLGAVGAEQLGYLSVAIRVASVAGLVVTGFQLAWLPHAYSQGTSDEALARTSTDGRRILVLTLGAVALVAATARVIVTLAGGQAYGEAVAFVAGTALAQFSTCVLLVASMPSALAKRTGPIGVAGLVASGSAVLLTALTSATLGPNAFGFGVIGGQLIGALMVWNAGKRFVAFRVGWRRIGALATAVAVASLAVHPSVGLPPLLIALVWAGLLLAFVAEGTAADLARNAMSLTGIER